ncbi:MAG TPA: indole-3-glycerol phosphate synthase TrpC [Polyangia bacterium]|jgi:indole-3-glycerol phosphate synthase|nr:indole-3-glycerol phosphate synthase TrpC [Polyangia bacterium]
MILDTIVAAKQRAYRERDPAQDRQRRERLGDTPPRRSLSAALRASQSGARGGFPQIIAEFKRRSPSAGPIRPGAAPADIAREYAAAGAAALSILTDAEFFDGDLAHLGAARAAVGLPLLRKDFLLYEEDLVDARLAGADAALLIARLLEDTVLVRLLETARQLGLEVLVEVHNAEECRRAVAAGATIVGVNHRDLDTLTLDLDLSARLAPLLPPQVTRVAESGLKSAADLAEMAARGYHAVLVGETLMRAPSPGAALGQLLTR